PGHDLAILVMCHHNIISTGTFGWWGAWLNRGMTIFYQDWPKPNSTLASLFVKDEFFLPYWIGMS
ncbi:hypothetical protein HELRODRAFT_138004, partial [Helobdella robusta]|uniref:L-Fucosyltransferase n=1 Tax=Helobdella robusta TaxID=6412 RepID=T1EIQ7_HELRO